MKSKPLGEALDTFRRLSEDHQELVIARANELNLPGMSLLHALITNIAQITTIKRCNKCHQHKPLTRFYRDGSKPDGRMYSCVACTRSNRGWERGAGVI